MKKEALYLCLLPIFVFGTSIDDIVNGTYKNNLQLKSIEESIKIASQNIKLSQKFQNPVLTLGANDIHFDEPLSRDKEAMQAQYIGISQTIESSKKLHLKQNIEESSKYIQELNLKDRKLYLSSLVYQKSWNILILNENIKSLKEYENNLEKLILLSDTYYELGKANQNDSLEFQIKLNEIKLKINALENQKQNLFVDLESISYLDIQNIDDTLKILDDEINIDLNNHPKIEILNEQINQQNSKGKLQEQKKFSDLKVNVTYFNRDEKFKDYANISVSIPLGINNRENIEIVKSKYEISRIKNNRDDLLRSLNSKIKNLKNDIHFSKQNIDLIKEKIIPIKRNIHENIENYISLNQENYKKVFIDLNDLILYELKINEYKKSYFNALSQLIYLNQGIINDKK